MVGRRSDGNLDCSRVLGSATPYHGNISGYAMDSMRFKWAILNVLSKRPGRRATLDDVRREVRINIESGDQLEPLNRFSALADIDIFQSGLVLRDDAGLEITDAGLSLLHALEGSSGPSPEISSAPASQEFKMIDDLIGTEDRLRIFDLGLRTLDDNTRDGNHPSAEDEKGRTTEVVTPNATSESSDVDPGDNLNSAIPEGVDNGNHDPLSPVEEIRTDAIETLDTTSQDAPAFLRRSFGAKVPDSDRNSFRLASLLALIGTKKQFTADLWRRHFAQGASNPRTERPVGRIGGAAFAFLSVFVVVTCVGAAIALGQIKSLKSDIALLHRELLPLKERLGKLEQIEKRKRDSDQQEEAQNKAGTGTNKPDGATRTDQPALSLSREEVQLIRDYIKPAPSAGTAAPAINVGDPVAGAMIPLPSPLTEKVPKLLGARFTTRNGAIIISTKGSRRADAVLAPN
jgi:hypothetical protein